MAGKIRSVSARARFIDRAGRYFIAAGGIGIIAAVLGILVFIARETMPLFATVDVEAPVSAEPPGAGRLLALGIDPYQEIAYAARPDGMHFFVPQSGTPLQGGWRPPDGVRIAAAGLAPVSGRVALGLDDGRVALGRVSYDIRFKDEIRTIIPRFRPLDTVDLAGGQALKQVVVADDGEGRSLVAGVTEDQRLFVRVAEQQQGLLGPGPVEDALFELSGDTEGPVTALLADAAARRLVAGTADGRVIEWRVQGIDAPPQVAEVFKAGEAAVTALAFLIGDVSVAVGDADGGLSTWFRVRQDGGKVYRRIHVFAPMGAAVTCIAPSQRDKQFASGDAEGRMALHHMTSEQTFFVVRALDEAVGALAFAPKADGLLAGGEGRTALLPVFNPHPEISLKVLFGKVWYEGYDAPEYVWQSTGGTDDFEPKISLVPLIFGTVKGTFYAILFALPLAVLGAMYTAEFAAPKVRILVKPTVEIMASLPSVILGFLAGLWLAPRLEEFLIGVFLMGPFVVLAAFGAARGWMLVPRSAYRWLPRQTEAGLMLAVTLLGCWLAFWTGPWVEELLFGGQLKAWITEGLGWRYDQRNAVVVGFAMGFAVVPLIFTICEDALSSVPASLRAGSLALGATRWQTATRVVLPMALPGIFSATMIGFGRAIGETMIVLMATGNTPILDWNIFNGMRTIAANIAVELPEAPHQGTLYRVLFLSGLLLFGATFFINTVAEIVRQRLRERYKQL